MKIDKFEITFTHSGQKVIASCQKFKVGRHPQYWVAYKNDSSNRTFTFYEIGEKELFWFAGESDLYGKKIASALKKHYSMQEKG